MNIDEFQVFQECVAQWGTTSQILMVIEELNELAVTLCHSLRANRPFDLKQIIEEMADVKLMLDQLQYMLSISNPTLDAMRKVKLQRLKDLLQSPEVILKE